jgi:demethylspheroidene O-methyltransferase
MAMQTGTVRSAARISELCQAAGFTSIRPYVTRRPFVTTVVTANRPSK